MTEEKLLKRTLADDDINENWEIYKERFLRGDFP